LRDIEYIVDPAFWPFQWVLVFADHLCRLTG
jgi:hypothetical protein